MKLRQEMAHDLLEIIPDLFRTVVTIVHQGEDLLKGLGSRRRTREIFFPYAEVETTITHRPAPKVLWRRV